MALFVITVVDSFISHLDKSEIEQRSQVANTGRLGGTLNA
jgi:hypothetical protein